MSRSSLLEPDEAPIFPSITISLIPETFISPSKTKNEPIPARGIEACCGNVITEVSPLDLFHGIRVEFALNALKILKPIFK